MKYETIKNIKNHLYTNFRDEKDAFYRIQRPIALGKYEKTNNRFLHFFVFYEV